MWQVKVSCQLLCKHSFSGAVTLPVMFSNSCFLHAVLDYMHPPVLSAYVLSGLIIFLTNLSTWARDSVYYHGSLFHWQWVLHLGELRTDCSDCPEGHPHTKAPTGPIYLLADAYNIRDGDGGLRTCSCSISSHLFIGTVVWLIKHLGWPLALSILQRCFLS